MMGYNMLGLYGMHSLYGIHHGFGTMGIIGGMGMFMILLLALVVAAIVWFSKKGSLQSNGSNYQTTTDRSLGILNERYASGEIDDDEYSKKKMELRKNNLV